MRGDDNNSAQESGIEDISLAELLRMAITDRLIDLHVALPARVESYDASKQTVTVSILLNKYVPDGNGGWQSEELPQLADVQVAHPRGGGFFLAMPLKKGDTGQLIFCERSVGTWRSTGNKSDPGDVRTHTLDGAVFHPCIAPDANAIQNADANNLVMGLDSDPNARIVVKPSGEIDLGSGATKGVARNGDSISLGACTVTTAVIGPTTVVTSVTINGVLLSAVPADPGGNINQGSGHIKAVD